MAFLLDINVLIALAWKRHVHHAPATSWFVAEHQSGWATTSLTESGFVRVSSNPRVFPDGVTPGQATRIVAAMRAVPGHEFWSDSVSFADDPELIDEHVYGSGDVTDAHLALIAKSHDGILVTFDSRASLLSHALGAQAVLLTA